MENLCILSSLILLLAVGINSDEDSIGVSSMFKLQDADSVQIGDFSAATPAISSTLQSDSAMSLLGKYSSITEKLSEKDDDASLGVTGLSYSAGYKSQKFPDMLEELGTALEDDSSLAGFNDLDTAHMPDSNKGKAEDPYKEVDPSKDNVGNSKEDQKSQKFPDVLSELGTALEDDSSRVGLNDHDTAYVPDSNKGKAEDPYKGDNPSKDIVSNGEKSQKFPDVLSELGTALEDDSSRVGFNDLDNSHVPDSNKDKAEGPYKEDPSKDNVGNGTEDPALDQFSELKAGIEELNSEREKSDQSLSGKSVDIGPTNKTSDEEEPKSNIDAYSEFLKAFQKENPGKSEGFGSEVQMNTPLSNQTASQVAGAMQNMSATNREKIQQDLLESLHLSPLDPTNPRFLPLGENAAEASSSVKTPEKTNSSTRSQIVNRVVEEGETKPFSKQFRPNEMEQGTEAGDTRQKSKSSEGLTDKMNGFNEGQDASQIGAGSIMGTENRYNNDQRKFNTEGREDDSDIVKSKEGMTSNENIPNRRGVTGVTQKTVPATNKPENLAVEDERDGKQEGEKTDEENEKVYAYDSEDYDSYEYDYVEGKVLTTADPSEAEEKDGKESAAEKEQEQLPKSKTEATGSAQDSALRDPTRNSDITQEDDDEGVWDEEDENNDWYYNPGDNPRKGYSSSSTTTTGNLQSTTKTLSDQSRDINLNGYQGTPSYETKSQISPPDQQDKVMMMGNVHNHKAVPGPKGTIILYTALIVMLICGIVFVSVWKGPFKLLNGRSSSTPVVRVGEEGKRLLDHPFV